MQRMQWAAGRTAQVAFSASINHGGGYAYRLCPAGATQTEECFQNHHLDFVGEHSSIRWTNGTELQISALTLSSGTHPAGSQWRAIRVPGCGGWVPSYGRNSRDLCNPALLPTHGIDFPGGALNLETYWDFSIQDTIAVPNLPSGDYTLSWRWDTELNPQVWQNCADIEITGGGPAPVPRPTPLPLPLPPTPIPAPTSSPVPSPLPVPAPGGGYCWSSSLVNRCGSCLVDTDCGTGGFGNNHCLNEPDPKCGGRSLNPSSSQMWYGKLV